MHNINPWILFLLSIVSTKICADLSTNIANAHFSLAHLLHKEGSDQEAIIHYQNTLKRCPNHKLALQCLGNLLLTKKCINEAIPYLEQRSQLPPADADLELILGAAYATKKEFDTAMKHYNKALSINPNSIEAYLNLGLIFQKKKQCDQAINCYQKVLSFAPKNVGAHIQLAKLFFKQKQCRKALEHSNKALAVKPDHPRALFEKANILSMMGNTQEALTLYDALLEKKAQPNILHNRAYALKQQGDYDQAIKAYKQVLEMQPHNLQAHLGSAYCYLTLGDYKKGWAAFAKFTLQHKKEQRLLSDPKDITGNTIFISVGTTISHDDMLLGVRYAHKIKEHGGTVIIQARPELSALFEHCDYIDTVISTTEKPPPHDKTIPLFCLPHLFGDTIETLPNTMPYIKADPELVDFWKEKLSYDRNIKVGIFWQNDDTQKLEPLLTAQGISFYMLNKHADKTTLAPTCIMHQCGSGFKSDASSINHLAALIENLDLIITIDGSIAHLAGALAKPVWLYLPKISSWHWMIDRTDSPWYPSMRIFRQQENGIWQSVIKDMSNNLHKLVASS